jgi:putative transposase
VVQLRYNYRLYPSQGQRQALAKAFGCARTVYNDGLRARQKAFNAGLPYLTDAELSAQLTAAKATQSGRGSATCPPWCSSRRSRT